MNLKLNDWNKSVEYVNETCKDFLNSGYDVRPKEYSMYDGRKGIYLQVFDNNGKFYTEYATGIHTNLEDMKKAIDVMAKRIELEL